MKTEATAVACKRTGPASTYNDNTDSTSVEGPANAGSGDGLRDDARGGRRLSDQVGAADVLAGPVSTEPGSDSTSRQIRLLADLPVSAVPYGVLRELVQAQVRRECRRRDYDWDAFVADGPEWGITEVVHRRAVQQERNRGLDFRPTDIPTDTVLTAVRGVIDEWTREPTLRPTEDDFRQEQARRGEKGRESQQKLAGRREAQVLALVADGISNNAEIGRRLGIDRSTVSRIRRDADLSACVALQETADAPTISPAFPAPEIPSVARWPVVRFTQWTGVTLDADDVRWLADVGRCYEAEGHESDLMDQIQMSAGARDPWAYLQRCVANRGDSWTVRSQLLADVLVWAGEKSLMYSLTAIGGGYIQRPLPYLREVLARAVRKGVGRSGSWERPVAMSVGMAREWASELVIVDADEAIAGEAVEERTGYVDSFRRRFGRLPWETETVPETAAGLETSDVPNRCIGLKGLRGDDSNYQNLEYRNLESSPGSVKADATRAPCEEVELERRAAVTDQLGLGLVAGYGSALGPPAWEREKLEHPLKTGVLPDSDEILRPESDGEARKLVKTAIDPLVGEKVPVVLEHGRCRHPLASLMASAMVLFDVVLVDCAAGCGHRFYSDRGPVDCPCHWELAETARVSRAAEERLASGGPFEK